MTQYVKKLIWVTFFFLFLAANMTQISNFANRVKKSMQIKQWNMTQIVNFANRVIISMLIKQWNMTQIVNFANRVKKSMLIKQWNMTQISIFSYRVKFYHFNIEYIGWIEYDVFNPTFFQLSIVLTQLNFNIIFCRLRS